MNIVKINFHALIPAGLLLVSYILSPQFYNVLPAKYATAFGFLASLASIFFPKLFEKQRDVKEE